MMRTIWTWMLILTAAMAYAMDPAFTPDDTPLTKDMKSRVVWVSPETDVPLASYLKDIQDKANSNYSTRITFRLLNSDGQEETLVTQPRTNAIPTLGGFRCSLYDFAKLICEAAELDYRLDEEKREIIFKRKKGPQQEAGVVRDPRSGSRAPQP
jgi:hypothetical protein